jgi:hypothetical protein
MICNECELKDLKKSVPKINFGKRKEETRILHGNNILATCEAFKNFIDVIKSDENFDFLFNGGITLHDHHLNMQRNESIEWCMGGFVKSEQGTILMQGDSGSHHTFCMIKGEKVIVIMTSSSHTAQFLHEWLFFESEETIEVPKWLAVKQIRGYSSEIIVSDKRKLDALRD